MTSNMTKSHDGLLSLIATFAVGGALITSGAAAIIMALRAGNDPVGFSSNGGEALIDAVTLASAAGAITGGAYGYGLFQDMKQREAEVKQTWKSLLKL